MLGMTKQRTNGPTLPSLSKTWLMIRASLATGVYFLELPLSVFLAIESSTGIIATSFTCWQLITKM